MRWMFSILRTGSTGRMSRPAPRTMPVRVLTAGRVGAQVVAILCAALAGVHCAHDPGPPAADGPPAPAPPADEPARSSTSEPAPGPAETTTKTAPAAPEPGAVQLTFTAPVPPTPRAPATDNGPWGDRVLRKAQSLPGVDATAAMACAAHGFGQARLDTGRPAGHRLKRIIPARCGAPVADVELTVLAVDIDPAVTDADVVDGFSGPLDRLLGTVRPGPYDIGGALLRAGTKTLAVLAVGLRRVRTTTLELDRAAGVLVAELAVEPSVAEAFLYDNVEPLITYGTWDVRRCDLDVTRALPAVAFVCPLDDDAPPASVAYATVTAYPQGAFLGHHLATLAVPGPAHDGSAHVLRAFVSQNPTADLLPLANRARAASGRPLLEAQAPSAAFLAEAKTLLGSLERQSPGADKAAQTALLSLMRGPDPARRADVGFVGWSTIGPEEDAGSLLAAAFAFADTRAVLMSPVTRTLVATERFDVAPGVTGLVFGTYRPAAAPDASAVRDIIDVRREALGLAAHAPWPGLQTVVDQAAADVARGFAPEEAIRARVQKAQLQDPVIAVVLDGPTLNSVKVVPELLADNAGRLALAAAYVEHGVVVVGVLSTK